MPLIDKLVQSRSDRESQESKSDTELFLSDSKLVFSCHYSGVEILNGLLYGVEEGSGLRVLRTFRLFRILKLVRFFPGLQRQLLVMLRTLDNVVVFFGLLSLFIFIFRFN